MKSFSTVADFQTSSSSLPSIVGGFSNFGIFTGLAFSGGNEDAVFVPPLPESDFPSCDFGLGAGLAAGTSVLSIELLRAHVGTQAITKRQRMRQLIRIVLFTFPAAEAEEYR